MLIPSAGMALFIGFQKHHAALLTVVSCCLAAAGFHCKHPRWNSLHPGIHAPFWSRHLGLAELAGWPDKHGFDLRTHTTYPGITTKALIGAPDAPIFLTSLLSYEEVHNEEAPGSSMCIMLLGHGLVIDFLIFLFQKSTERFLRHRRAC